MDLTVLPEAETGDLVAPASKVPVVRVHWSALLGSKLLIAVDLFQCVPCVCCSLLALGEAGRSVSGARRGS